jgi:hypothetical protein
MYQQGVFFYGGMNTDDEDRLITNGDYRSATFSRNYGVNSPSEGALQSMTGNLLRNNTTLPGGVNIVIGACEDVEYKALILFVFNDLGQHTIWRYTVENLQYQLILQNSILNFKKTNQIFHASVVNNLLYWTDNYFNSYTANNFNPPRKINIQKAILYTQSAGTNPNGYSEITFNNLDWIKHPPLFSPTFVYDSDTTENSNNLKNKLFQFRYQYVYDDNEESAWSPISEMTLPTASEYIGQTVNIDPYIDNTIALDISTGSSIARLIRVAYRIGNTGEFFLYKEYDKTQLGWSDYTTETIDFKNETSGPAISNSERNYDLIPQIAKTIEYLPSNEFAIGNYIEGYDKQEITNNDVSFFVENNAINNTTFAYPLAAFYNDFNPSTPAGKQGFYIFFNPIGDDFVKYRYQPGDVLIIQLKNYSVSTGNIITTDPVIYFTVPFLDPSIYTTDLLKLNQLCVLLQTDLLTLGISSTVEAPGSATGPFPSVAWPSLKVANKTWYNRTQAQATQTTNGLVIVLRENKATRTFKSGAKHEFAFQYYDRANRDGTVLTVPAGEVYVPFNTDYTNIELNSAIGLNRSPYYTTIKITIDENYRPPSWADTYQVVYKPSTNISNFQQRSVKEVIFNADSTAKLILENYYKNSNGGQFIGASINQTPSKGDFVRFVRRRALFNKDFEPLAILEGPIGTYAMPASPDAVENVVPLFNDDLAEIYDPYGYINPTSKFIPPTTQSYNIKVNLSFNITYPGGSPITQVLVKAYIRNIVTGVSQLIGSTTELFYSSGLNLQINAAANLTLTASQGHEIRITVLYITPSPPQSINLNFNTVANSLVTYSLATSDYDNFKYYPGYVTKENNLNQELNVLSYDPSGGPVGEEVVIVNNFDINLLGDYLVFSGTDPNRAICTGGFQIEIYTPKLESENDPWYEVGTEFPILNPHGNTRSHGGDINQVYGTTNGEVYLDCGDVYIRQRVMSTGYQYVGGSATIGDANDNLGAWFCEDPHYSDFYVSNWNNKGRLALFSAFAKQQHLKSSIYHTNALIDNTQINGLSRIEFFNNVALKDEHGGINKLIQIGDTLKAFQDKKVTSVYIQKAFALNGDGTNNVILSDKTFAGVRPHDDDYGCIHPGSVSKVENNVFFYDFYNAAVVQATQGGLINICDGEHKFSVGVRNFTDNIRSYETLAGMNSNVVSHINRSNGEYALYAGTNIDEIPNSVQFLTFIIDAPSEVRVGGNFTYLFTPGSTFTITGATFPSNNGTRTVTSSSYDGSLNRTIILVSPGFVSDEKPSPGTLVISPEINISTEGIVYSFNRQRWTSYTNHPVIFAYQFGNRAYTSGGSISSNIGKLFEEDKGTELTFFSKGESQQIDFLFNSNPTIVKRFLTFTTQSNMPFSVDVTVPATNQYPTGMSSDILIDNFRNQESYYVSKYFRDKNDPNPYVIGVLKRLNGRELRGYVLKHSLTNTVTSKKMILFSANVNFVPSEPIMQ